MIYYYGTLPGKDESKTGGGEWGNLRTVNMLKYFGYDVYTFRKTLLKPTRPHVVIVLSFPIRFVYDLLRVFLVLLFGNRNSVFHFSGFAWKTIFSEYLMISMVRLLGYRVIYEIRGGAMMHYYHIGSERHKKMLTSILNKSSYVFSQGMENIPLIKSLCDTPVFHYANCVEDDFYPKQNLKRTADPINLLYFGRISPDKNVLLIIEAVTMLQKRLNGVTLTIIGNANDVAYREKVETTASKSLKEGSCHFFKGCSHEELKLHLQNKHFYLFPSEVILEGQSNALTEAMSYGIIPIASPQGFNRSVVGNDELIVDKLQASDYADKIYNIVKADRVQELSNQVFSHFKKNFTKEIVFNKSRVVYEEILKGNKN